MADLEEAIRTAQETVDATPQDQPSRVIHLNSLASLLDVRYSRTKAIVDLENAIQAGREAVDTIPAGSSILAPLLHNLGVRLWSKYLRTGAIVDLKDSIQVERGAIDATSENHTNLVPMYYCLGIGLRNRYSKIGEMADLIEAIEVIRKAIDIAPNNSSQAELLASLGNAVGDRYTRTGDETDLEEAIQVTRQAISMVPENYPDRPGWLSNLGLRLMDKYSRAGALADLEEEIKVTQQAIDLTPNDHPNLAKMFVNLGLGLRNRYLKTGEISDLENAIQVSRKAIDMTPKAYPDRAIYFNNLGLGLMDKYTRTGLIAELEEAIGIGREVIAMTLETDTNRARYLTNLGIRLRERYLRTDVLTDLEESIRIGREAIDSIPNNHPTRAACLNNLGLGIGDRYLRTSIITDLDEAIQIAREALDATPEDHVDRAERLNNLGIRLWDKCMRIGTIADLEEAIQVGRETTDLTPKGHPRRAQRLNNLGVQLRNRYLRMGAMIDLDEAIRIGQEAIDTCPEHHPDLAAYLNYLGSGLWDRYLRSKMMVDLEEAIQSSQKAIVLTPEDHPERPSRLSNLGLLLGTKHSDAKEIHDLDESIRLIRQAINITPKGHSDRASFLSNLELRLRDRYLRTGVLTDLEEAIQIGRVAIDLISENHADRAMHSNIIGNLLGHRYLRTEVTADLNEAISHHQLALRQPAAFILTRIEACIEILRYCAMTSDWRQAYEASEIAVHLIPRLMARSLENRDKQYILSQVFGLASDAAAAALSMGKEPLIALEFLELGRSVLAASVEDMRTDIQDLQGRHPNLAEQFVSLRDELELPVTRNISFVGDNRQLPWQVGADHRYKTGKEFDKLIIEIRKQPGFESFLQAPNCRDMQAAARYGPIIVINPSNYRCDAIIVEQNQMRSLALPRLNRNDIKQIIQGASLSSPKVLEWLWDVVANPILEALGLAQPRSDNKWEYVWWIPIGLLSRFPLHAAGYHGKHSSETVIDRVISTYSSSIKSIIYCRRRRLPPSTSNKALLIAMKDTPGMNVRLPFAAREVAMVHGLCESMAFEPIEPKRCREEVMSHLLNSNIFHFAGHGYTDALDPSKSNLRLEDWGDSPLRVADLLDMNLRERSPFLAYLSACGTGRIKDEKFIDESIHLIGACQLAGFRHVVGTLWEVNDELCVDMARITYEGIRDGGMTDESVRQGLHKATRELRDRWLNGSAKIRRGSESVRKRDTFLVNDGTSVRSANDEDQRGGDLQRKAEVQYKSDNVDSGALLWVPYVHFGV
jgi:tetratricopeptide (TPR) repeat protein